MTADDLLDALADLQHDLGKYIAMPVTMLPIDATNADLRAAIQGALFETRRGPTGVRSARSIWGGFVNEVEESLNDKAAWGSLVAAVTQAFSWEDRLVGNASIDRGAVTKDLLGVSHAIRELMKNVQEAS